MACHIIKKGKYKHGIFLHKLNITSPFYEFTTVLFCVVQNFTKSLSSFWEITSQMTMQDHVVWALTADSGDRSAIL